MMAASAEPRRLLNRSRASGRTSLNRRAKVIAVRPSQKSRHVEHRASTYKSTTGAQVPRPKKEGDRYPSGDLKPQQNIIAPTVWARMKADAIKLFKDPKWGSELSRLSVHEVFTNAQTAAGFRIGEIYHRYHRLKRLRTSPKSPNYEGSAGGSSDLAEERMTGEQLAEFEATVRKAEAEWCRIDAALDLLGRDIRTAVIELCVHDRAILATLHADVAKFLDAMSLRFADKAQKPRRKGAPLSRAAPSARGDAPAARRSPGLNELTLRAVEAIARKIRPDLDDDGVGMVKTTFTALLDRAHFNERKATKRSP
jgi:hypothetical protein